MNWNTALRIGVGAAGLVVVAAVLVTAWGGVLHGHPAHLIALVVTGLGCIAVIGAALVPGRRAATPPRRWRLVGLVAALIVAGAWFAVLGWARPHTATADGLLQMRSDASVQVRESATRIVLTPGGSVSSTAVVFLPGALVDARAYAAVLRPLAEAGHPVVIVKEPFGIAFLATGALDDARAAVPAATGWVVAGHSLGGTVASQLAEEADDDPVAPAVGLLLWASYPAGDVSGSLSVRVLSLSGGSDGLATPAKIDASRAHLPAHAEFQRLPGVSHAQFGAYGAQSGDGTPTVSDAVAAASISEASLRFVQTVAS